MISIPARWSAAALCSLVLLVMLGASSCGKNPVVNPKNYPPTTKNTRPVPCDTTINVNLAGGVDLDAAYVCENDKVTWVVQKPHTFRVEFKGGSPFDKDKFNEQDPTRTVKSKYDKLEVYKYSITVDSLPTKDPQVVGGGNP